MKALLIKPKSKEEMRALKAFAKAMKIDFDILENSYNPLFVEKIQQGRQDISNGLGMQIDLRNIWK